MFTCKKERGGMHHFFLGGGEMHEDFHGVNARLMFTSYTVKGVMLVFMCTVQ
jgi:hypothetical protein